MQTSDIKKVPLFAIILIGAFIFSPHIETAFTASAPAVPFLPDTGVAEASSTNAVATTTPAATAAAPVMPAAPAGPKPKPAAEVTTVSAVADTSKPVTLSIPELGMQSPVIGVGTNSKGEMDVPSGSSNNVGWYEYGTMPGQIGSAVIDAHVFAAFSKLRGIAAGDLIYVRNESGQKLAFKVEEVDTYALADVPADKLFNRNDTARLNLITCAGHLTPDHSTYDHRLVAYAVYVGVV